MRRAESMTGFVFHLPVWDLLLPLAFSVSYERHRQGGVNEIAQVSKQQQSALIIRDQHYSLLINRKC